MIWLHSSTGKASIPLSRDCGILLSFSSLSRLSFACLRALSIMRMMNMVVKLVAHGLSVNKLTLSIYEPDSKNKQTCSPQTLE